MTHSIWLIGGTSESVQLAELLIQSQVSCIVTVTTETASQLYPNSPYLQVKVGRLIPSQILELIQQEQIRLILDASHPFAVEISKTAIAVSQQLSLPYLRYERPFSATQNSALISYYPDFETLLSGKILQNQRVLLTVGYKALHYFQVYHDQATLFTRILPSVESIQAALAAGFTSDRIFALRPPIPLELEQELWRYWQIDLVVTKASGKAGGEEIKKQVSQALNLPLVIIERPPIVYPRQTDNLQIAVEFCLENLPTSTE